MGHRGVPTLAPENTLASFRMADQLRIPWVECDAEVLGDGTVVICHDADLKRCSNRSGKLAKLTKDDLKTIDAGSWFDIQFKGERIPTLEELLLFINKSSLRLNLEIKSCPNSTLTHMLLDGVVTGLKLLWKKERPLIVSSFNHAVLAEFKKRMPDIPVACLFERNKLSSNWPEIMAQTNASYIHPSVKGLKQASVIEAKKRGYGINVWTVNNLSKAVELFDWGVDGICTDIPQHFPEHWLDYTINN